MEVKTRGNIDHRNTIRSLIKNINPGKQIGISCQSCWSVQSFKRAPPTPDWSSPRVWQHTHKTCLFLGWSSARAKGLAWVHLSLELESWLDSRTLCLCIKLLALALGRGPLLTEAELRSKQKRKSKSRLKSEDSVCILCWCIFNSLYLNLSSSKVNPNRPGFWFFFWETTFLPFSGIKSTT